MLKVMQEWRDELLAEGENKGREVGREEGSIGQLIRMSMKKYHAGKPVAVIASELEEPEEQVQKYVDLIKANPDETNPENLVQQYLSGRAARSRNAAAD